MHKLLKNEPPLRTQNNYTLSIVYLSIALPILIALCFFIGSFQVPDEPSHFLRLMRFPMIIFYSSLHLGAVVQEASLMRQQKIVEQLGNQTIDRIPNHRFATKDRSPFQGQEHERRESISDIQQCRYLFSECTSGSCHGDKCARMLEAAPLLWFYLRRPKNRVTASLMSTFAISLLTEGALLAFKICMPPMVLFQKASVSANCLVIAYSVTLA